MVEFVGVTRAYGPRLALDDVNLALEPGELAFLVGPSGAGKTTLLKLINREIRPTKGEVWVDGIPAHLLKASRVEVTDLRVSDEEASDRALDALEAVGLGDRGGAFPQQLSGGQQQRVAVARAVVAQPPLLIADEPTGNLDLETSWEMMDLFADIAAFGTAVLIATHNVEIVRRLQRRVITLVQGRLVRDQPAGRTGRLTWLASS